MLEQQDILFIQQELGWTTQPSNVGRLSGGDINEVFQIEMNSDRYVVKKNDKLLFPEMLDKEGRALKYVEKNVPQLYPKAVGSFASDDSQFLVLVYHEKGDNTKQGQIELSKQLARHHRHTNDQYGWAEDNYIGSLPQSNSYKSTWDDFYAENRLLAQTKQAFDQGYVDRRFIQKMEAFCNELPSIFPKEEPALLHGDLWGGNYFINIEEKPVLYDPAMYFGHREIDIAMTRLFGGFSETFYEHYCAEYPLVEGWDKRIPFGQLYPNLVHLNLFGPAYLDAVTTVINPF